MKKTVFWVLMIIPLSASAGERSSVDYIAIGIIIGIIFTFLFVAYLITYAIPYIRSEIVNYGNNKQEAGYYKGGADAYKDSANAFGLLTATVVNAVANRLDPSPIHKGLPQTQYADTHTHTRTQHTHEIPYDEDKEIQVTKRLTERYRNCNVAYSPEYIRITVDGVDYLSNFPIDATKCVFTSKDGVELPGLKSGTCKESSCNNRWVSDSYQNDFCSDRCKNKYNNRR